MRGPVARLLPWLERRAPPVHRFLTRQDRFYPVLREILVVGLALLLLFGGIWAYTGQRPGDAPVVVIESGSMMHCRNGVGFYYGDCEEERYGRLGTIDPGDLVFVRDVDRRSDVETFAGGGERRYGLSGDVIVFQKNGLNGTPIIHRAAFWLQVNEDGSLTIPELNQTVQHPSQFQFDRAEYRAGPGCQLEFPHGRTLRPEDSGFITKGDNNLCFDQSNSPEPSLPVRVDWILGKARGEVPWVGLIKLKFSDLWVGTDNYDNAPRDVRTMLWVAIAVLVGAPILYEFAMRAWRRRRGDGDGGDGDAGQGAAKAASAPPGTPAGPPASGTSSAPTKPAPGESGGPPQGR